MHRILQVSYDLRTKAKPDYEGLYQELKRTEEWFHALESTWLLWTDESPQDVWNRLYQHVHRTDSIIINDVGKRHWGYMPEKVWEWIAAREPSLIRAY